MHAEFSVEDVPKSRISSLWRHQIIMMNAVIWRSIAIWTVFYLSSTTWCRVKAFSLSKTPVSQLLERESANIDSLKAEAAKVMSNPPDSNVFYLRYCLANFDNPDERMTSLLQTLTWRKGVGKSICDAAESAVSQAMSRENQRWDNRPVRDSAPHASIVNRYITPSQIITTTSRPGDLVYCIRAGKIDDTSLMSELTVDDMTDFFLYCKEVNAIVANKRSIETDRLISVITANDLTGVKLIGGDASFRKALSEASKKANDLYPCLAGPTLLLNLPPLFGALVKLFTPLFPEEVRRRLKFEQGPLKDVDDLTDVFGGKAREKFLSDLDDLVYRE